MHDRIICRKGNIMKDRKPSFVVYMFFVSAVLAVCSGCGGGGGGGVAGGGNGAPGNAPAPSTSPTGTQMNWDMPTSTTTNQKTAYTMPDGLAIIEDGTHGWVTMVGNNGKATNDAYYGECRVALVGIINDKNLDLDSLALDTLNLVFLPAQGNNPNLFGDNPANWSGIFGQGAGGPLQDSTHLRGLTGEGWPYVELQGSLQRASGAARYEDVRILLAQLNNNQYAAMIGYAYNYPLCVGEGANDSGKWVNLVHSLSFPGYQPADPDVLRKKLYGGWYGTYVGRMNKVWSYIFAANGQEQNLVGISVYTPIAETSLVYDSSSTWIGNGSWQLNQAKLSIWPDNDLPYTHYVRYYESYNSSSNSWDIYLRLLDQCNDTSTGVTTTANCENWVLKEQ
jgi:hypothetical protein